MPNWTDSKGIKQIVLKKWEKGTILSSAFQQDNLFPLRIKLTSPTSDEMSKNYSDIVAWIKLLNKQEKTVLGFGYTLIVKEYHDKICGKNIIPTHVEFATPDDVVQWLGKQEEMRLFTNNAKILLQDWECLRAWICNNPFQVIRMGNNCTAFLAVLHWFAQHDNRNLYLRQLDIEGIDTKFIELYKGLISQMLDIILPAENVNESSSNFEKRYGLKSKPIPVRFRILDEKLKIAGCTDISVPIEEFQQLKLPFKRCFITENEINFLSFPAVPDACVIFGKGYGAELFQNTAWLKTVDIYYWGDIDTHGFNILSMVRSFLPQTKSFLMTQDILLSHQSLWAKEEKQFIAPIEHLTCDEYPLACKLQANHWGEGVRLEQERISFSYVENFLGIFSEK
ncbi:MAG: DUF2220 family protein [Oscillospiraceae bacterium]